MAEICMTLIPYDKREGIPLNVAAERASKSGAGTIHHVRLGRVSRKGGGIRGVSGAWVGRPLL